MKYLYLIALGGLNDIFCRIEKYIKYCRENNRLLFIDTRYGTYRYNILRYLIIKDNNVIQNINYFKNIDINKLSFYPNEIKYIFDDIINKKFIKQNNKNNLIFRGQKLNEDVIVCCESGGGDSFDFFYKHVFIKNKIKDYIKEKAKLIKVPYIAIHIRNTDIVTDYKKIYLTNKNLIHKYSLVYVATDNKNVISYFKNKNLNVKNFTQFPKLKHKNLHSSNLSCETKFKNLFTDMYMILKADKVILESQGGFANLLKICYKYKDKIIPKLK